MQTQFKAEYEKMILCCDKMPLDRCRKAALCGCMVRSFRTHTGQSVTGRRAALSLHAAALFLHQVWIIKRDFVMCRTDSLIFSVMDIMEDNGKTFSRVLEGYTQKKKKNRQHFLQYFPPHSGRARASSSSRRRRRGDSAPLASFSQSSVQ